MWMKINILSNIAKHFDRLDGNQTWYHLSTQFNFNMFGHRTMFDRVWPPNMLTNDKHSVHYQDPTLWSKLDKRASQVTSLTKFRKFVLFRVKATQRHNILNSAKTDIKWRQITSNFTSNFWRKLIASHHWAIPATRNLPSLSTDMECVVRD